MLVMLTYQVKTKILLKKVKSIFTSYQQNAGQIHNIKIEKFFVT
jgi:hypothetical protein